MSRLADYSDLKQRIQEMTGIPVSDFWLCRAEIAYMKDKDDSLIVEQRTKFSLLTDKDGLCSQFS